MESQLDESQLSAIRMRRSVEATRNPFSACFIRPDSVPFLDDGDILDTAVQQFQDNQFVGQIVGPHGCGKTCLAIAIQKELKSKFESTRRITIRNTRDILVARSDNPFREIVAASQVRDPKGLLIVDGFERLPRLHQWLLRKNAIRDGGLLITTHSRLPGLPVICNIKPDLRALIRVVEFLAPNLQLDPVELADIFNRNNHNVRETLMSLYDHTQGGC